MVKTPILSILLLMTSASGLIACTDGSAKADQATAPTSPPAAGAAATAAPAVAPDKVVVYYFHGTRRCRTCLGIQETIAKTIEERFAAETGSGALVFREVNIDEPENRHLVGQFDLSFSTMVVAANKGDATLEWRDCKDVWQHAHDPEALASYAETNIRAYLAMLEAR